MSPLAGLRYVVTFCATSAGYAGVLHLSARHAFDEDGSFTTEIVAGPNGALPDVGPTGTAELIAEQGDALIFRSRVEGEGSTSTTVLTLHSASTGEVFSTSGEEWVRGVAAIESLPEIAHGH
ncbi:MAG: hypothetical protein ACR2JV_06945 [Gaiellales bacterium]